MFPQLQLSHLFVTMHLNISLPRIAKDDNLSPELGIIIAKKRLKDVPTTGFLVVHIEPDGLIDR